MTFSKHMGFKYHFKLTFIDDALRKPVKWASYLFWWTPLWFEVNITKVAKSPKALELQFLHHNVKCVASGQTARPICVQARTAQLQVAISKAGDSVNSVAKSIVSQALPRSGDTKRPKQAALRRSRQVWLHPTSLAREPLASVRLPVEQSNHKSKRLQRSAAKQEQLAIVFLEPVMHWWAVMSAVQHHSSQSHLHSKRLGKWTLLRWWQVWLSLCEMW